MRIPTVTILASLLVLACESQQDGSTKPESKAAGDAKAGADAKAGDAGKPEVAPPMVPEEPEEPPADDDFGGEFCDTIIPCYQKLEFAGSFTADVSVDIEPDGSVSSVSFTGQAPKPVQSCIVDGIKAIKLTAYNGKPGRTRCTKSGQLMGGTQMIMSDHTYQVRDPGAPSSAEANEGEAEAEPKGEPGKTAAEPKPSKVGKTKAG